MVVHDLNPLLSVLDGAIYLLDGHAHYGAIGDVIDSELLTHLYDTPIKVVRTAQGDSSPGVSRGAHPRRRRVSIELDRSAARGFMRTRSSAAPSSPSPRG